MTVKENALALLERKRRSTLLGKTIYMSSVTDPYQPIEKRLGLTRELLRILAERYQPRLVIQTRSPLVTRDVDLLRRFEHVQVNMTITTDSEEVRRAFEPTCPNNRVPAAGHPRGPRSRHRRLHHPNAALARRRPGSTGLEFVPPPAFSGLSCSRSTPNGVSS